MAALVEEVKYAFFEGNIVPIEQAKVSIMTQALHYGTACYEGLRGYWNTERKQLYVFRMPEHYERFRNGWRMLMMHLPYSVDELCAITRELLRRERFEKDVYIRPLAYKATLGPGCRLNDLQDECAIFALPFGKYIDRPGGARVGVSSWRRIDDSIVPPRGKITGAYANSAFAKSEALLNGFDEAILLSQDGHVSEGPGENLFIVRKGCLITPPVSDNILEGITRDTLIELASEELGLPVLERTIDRTELWVAEEAFFCGTGVEISAIIEIDHRPVGDGQVGPIVSQMSKLYFDIVRGKVGKYSHWCSPVY